MLATVSGRFHYLLDTLAGAALAIAVVVAYRYLSGDGARREAVSAREGWLAMSARLAGERGGPRCGRDLQSEAGARYPHGPPLGG